MRKAQVVRMRKDVVAYKLQGGIDLYPCVKTPVWTCAQLNPAQLFSKGKE